MARQIKVESKEAAKALAIQLAAGCTYRNVYDFGGNRVVTNVNEDGSRAYTEAYVAGEFSHITVSGAEVEAVIEVKAPEYDLRGYAEAIIEYNELEVEAYLAHKKHSRCRSDKASQKAWAAYVDIDEALKAKSNEFWAKYGDLNAKIESDTALKAELDKIFAEIRTEKDRKEAEERNAKIQAEIEVERTGYLAKTFTLTSKTEGNGMGRTSKKLFKTAVEAFKFLEKKTFGSLTEYEMVIEHEGKTIYSRGNNHEYTTDAEIQALIDADNAHLETERAATAKVEVETTESAEVAIDDVEDSREYFDVEPVEEIDEDDELDSEYWVVSETSATETASQPAIETAPKAGQPKMTVCEIKAARAILKEILADRRQSLFARDAEIAAVTIAMIDRIEEMKDWNRESSQMRWSKLYAYSLPAYIDENELKSYQKRFKTKFVYRGKSTLDAYGRARALADGFPWAEQHINYDEFQGKVFNVTDTHGLDKFSFSRLEAEALAIYILKKVFTGEYTIDTVDSCRETSGSKYRPTNRKLAYKILALNQAETAAESIEATQAVEPATEPEIVESPEPAVESETNNAVEFTEPAEEQDTAFTFNLQTVPTAEQSDIEVDNGEDKTGSPHDCTTEPHESYEGTKLQPSLIQTATREPFIDGKANFLRLSGSPNRLTSVVIIWHAGKGLNGNSRGVMTGYRFESDSTVNGSHAPPQAAQPAGTLGGAQQRAPLLTTKGPNEMARIEITTTSAKAAVTMIRQILPAAFECIGNNMYRTADKRYGYAVTYTKSGDFFNALLLLQNKLFDGVNIMNKKFSAGGKAIIKLTEKQVAEIREELGIELPLKEENRHAELA